MTEELRDIYNVDGKIIRHNVPRNQELQAGEYVLLVQIWVKNSDGEYLIQKRAEHLRRSPGIWATTAGGVQAGEGILETAVRELAEEMGIQAEAGELQEVLQKTWPNSFGTAWLLERDVVLTNLIIQTEEVSEVKWVSPETILQMVEDSTFYDYGADYFRVLFAN